MTVPGRHSGRSPVPWPSPTTDAAQRSDVATHPGDIAGGPPRATQTAAKLRNTGTTTNARCVPTTSDSAPSTNGPTPTANPTASDARVAARSGRSGEVRIAPHHSEREMQSDPEAAQHETHDRRQRRRAQPEHGEADPGERERAVEQPVGAYRSERRPPAMRPAAMPATIRGHPGGRRPVREPDALLQDVRGPDRHRELHRDAEANHPPRPPVPRRQLVGRGRIVSLHQPVIWNPHPPHRHGERGAQDERDEQPRSPAEPDRHRAPHDEGRERPDARGRGVRLADRGGPRGRMVIRQHRAAGAHDERAPERCHEGAEQGHRERGGGAEEHQPRRTPSQDRRRAPRRDRSAAPPAARSSRRPPRRSRAPCRGTPRWSG